MKAREVHYLMLYVGEIWPHYEIPGDPELLETRTQAWLDILGDLDQTVVRGAIAQLGTREFPPTPGMIRSAAQDLIALAGADPSMPDTDQALAELFRQIAKVGYVGTPEWSHPALGATVAALGGWMEVCRSENVEALRAHFRQLYGTCTARADRETRGLPPVVARILDGVIRTAELTA